MANEERGEVDLTVGDKVYTLFLSVNAVCELQAKHKKTYGEILASLPGMDYVSLRDLVWTLLKKHHRKQFPNPELVGDFLDDAGGLRAVITPLKRIFELSQPSKEDLVGGEQDGGAGPLGAPEANGGGSTKTPS